MSGDAPQPTSGGRRKGVPAEPVDPRVRLVPGSEDRLRGVRCTVCGHPVAEPLPVCPLCRAPVREAEFGPLGTVWSSTVVRVPVPGRTPPYGLAYVDLHDGPRVIVHVLDAGGSAVQVGSTVRVSGVNETGDVQVQVVTKGTP